MEKCVSQDRRMENTAGAEATRCFDLSTIATRLFTDLSSHLEAASDPFHAISVESSFLPSRLVNV